MNVSNTANTDDQDPSWSPDGQKIAFTSGSPTESLYTVNPDGTGRTAIATGPLGTGIIGLDWSPNASKLVFSSDFLNPDSNDPVGFDLYTVDRDGSALTRILSRPGWQLEPTWSPNGERIGFHECPANADDCTFRDPLGCTDIYECEGDLSSVKPDGTDLMPITSGPTADVEPSWQPIPINAYPRPKGATPLRVSLVPANAQCTAPDETHGAPLAFGSCNPPALTSQYLTTGTPDANGRSARMNAYLLLKAVAGDSTPPDEADVEITAHLNDVANKNLSDYTGALRAVLPLRVTDKDNTPSPGGPGAATTQPFQYGFDIPCTPDPDPGIGSDCSITTTADTLVPGTIKESLRTVWQIGRVRVDDGGADGDPSTTAGNTVFAVQGVFIP